MRNKFIPKFPKNEKGILFYNPEGKPFFAAQVGITCAFPEYSIEYKKPANDNMTILEYVLEGEMEILINGVWQKAVAGDTYVLTECVAHRYHTVPNNPCKKIFVNYYSEYLPHFLLLIKSATVFTNPIRNNYSSIYYIFWITTFRTPKTFIPYQIV